MALLSSWVGEVRLSRYEVRFAFLRVFPIEICDEYLKQRSERVGALSIDEEETLE